MSVKDKIEAARKTLHCAMNKNCDEQKILKISREIDRYIVEHYKTYNERKVAIYNADDNLKAEKTLFSSK